VLLLLALDAALAFLLVQTLTRCVLVELLLENFGEFTELSVAGCCHHFQLGGEVEDRCTNGINLLLSPDLVLGLGGR
jgi:hypothetical protein